MYPAYTFCNLPYDMPHTIGLVAIFAGTQNFSQRGKFCSVLLLALAYTLNRANPARSHQKGPALNYHRAFICFESFHIVTPLLFSSTRPLGI